MKINLNDDQKNLIVILLTNSMPAFGDFMIGSQGFLMGQITMWAIIGVAVKYGWKDFISLIKDNVKSMRILMEAYIGEQNNDVE